MSDCIFCKIINKEIPSNIAYEDELVLAFHDISPAAPVHLLVVPKDHIVSANELEDSNLDSIKHVYRVIKMLAVEFGIDKSGYRIVNNCGVDGGQTVHHIHFHLIGGKKLDTKMA